MSPASNRRRSQTFIYSRVTCSKCQLPCWNIAYIGLRPVCNECLGWFEVGRPAITPSGRCYW